MQSYSGLVRQNAVELQAASIRDRVRWSVKEIEEIIGERKTTEHKTS